jgi:hypothetical protein
MTNQRFKNPEEKNYQPNPQEKDNKSFKTFTYTSSKQDPLNPGSLIITSSKVRESKNSPNNERKIHHRISIRKSKSRSNSTSKNSNNRAITIIHSNEYIETDKDENNGEIIASDSDKKYLNKNRNTNIGRTYVTNFNIRNIDYVQTEPKKENKYIGKIYEKNEKVQLQNTNDKNNNKYYKYIRPDNRTSNTYNQNQNNIKNNDKNPSITNPISNQVNNVYISSYTTKRLKDYNNEDNNKTKDSKYNNRIYYNTVNNRTDKNQELLNNKDANVIKDIKSTANKPIQNKLNNITFVSSNFSKNKIDQNKEKKNEPIIHNTQVYISRRKASNNNDNNNNIIISKPEIKKDNKYLTNKNENKIENKLITNINPTKDITKKDKDKTQNNYKNKEIKNINVNDISNKINFNSDKIEDNIKEYQNKKDINIYKGDTNLNNNINKDEGKTDGKEEGEKIEDIKLNYENKDDIIKNENKNIDINLKNEDGDKEINMAKNEEDNKNNENNENKYDYLINEPTKLYSDDFLKNNVDLKELDIYKGTNIFDKYDLLNIPELSDYSKIYLTSHTSNLRPELNDYTKAYLDSLSINNEEIRPELSNLTKEYLSKNVESDNKKEEEKEQEQEQEQEQEEKQE